MTLNFSPSRCVLRGGSVAPTLLTQWGQPAGWGQCPLVGCGRFAVMSPTRFLEPSLPQRAHLLYPHQPSLQPTFTVFNTSDPTGFSPAPPPGTESPPGFVPLPPEVSGFGGLGGRVQNQTRARLSRWRRSTLSMSRAWGGVQCHIPETPQKVVPR